MRHYKILLTAVITLSAGNASAVTNNSSYSNPGAEYTSETSAVYSFAASEQNYVTTPTGTYVSTSNKTPAPPSNSTKVTIPGLPTSPSIDVNNPNRPRLPLPGQPVPATPGSVIPPATPTPNTPTISPPNTPSVSPVPPSTPNIPQSHNEKQKRNKLCDDAYKTDIAQCRLQPTAYLKRQCNLGARQKQLLCKTQPIPQSPKVAQSLPGEAPYAIEDDVYSILGI